MFIVDLSQGELYKRYRCAVVQGEGGGFGLAAARLIAGGHDGELRLADTEDGSRFELILPCDPKEA
jgi:nitrogen-specific signal transduction histidine kinase